MEIVKSISILDHAFLSDSHIMSEADIDETTVSDLIYAQNIVEAQWLGEFPAFIIPFHPDIKHFTPLYEDVKLLLLDDWRFVDGATTFLLNLRMYNLCKSTDGAYPALKYSTSAGLLELFQDHMFVVATAGN